MRRQHLRFVAALLLLVAALLIDIFVTPSETLPAAPYVVVIAVSAYLLDSRRMVFVGASAVLIQTGADIYQQISPLVAEGAVFTTGVVALLAVAITRKRETEIVLQRKADALERERAVAEERERQLGVIQQQNEELQAQREELASQNEELIQANRSLMEAEDRLKAHTERLEAIQHVTDAALSQLHLDDLLQELLHRIKGVLSSDTATILILDADGDHLYVRASDGLAEEVESKVQIPIGQGVAGRIAASRQPMVFKDLSEGDVVSPLLQRKLRSLIGVPLITYNRLIGVLHVGTVELHQFIEDDMSLLQLVADRAALAIDNARLFGEMQYERERWHGTVDSMLDPVTVGDAEGHAIYMNRAYSRLIDMEIKEGLLVEDHPSYYRLYHPDGTIFDPEELPLQKAALRDEEVRNVEVIQRTASGEERIAVFNASPLHGEDGRVVGSVAIGRDITEQRRAEQERERLLRELEDQNSIVESIVQTMPATVALTLGSGHLIRYANPRYQATKPNLEMVGKSIRDVFPELEEQGFYDILDEIYRTGQTFDLPERAVELESDGKREVTYWNIRYAPLKSAQGQTIGILHFGVNVTDQVAAKKMAEGAVRVRDEFLSIASHELKTPLTSLVGFAQLLIRSIDRSGEVEPARLRHVASIINEQSNKLANLVDRLLDVSRIAAGKLVLEPNQLDIGALVRGAVENAKARGDGRRVKLNVASGIEVTADQLRLEQVLTNLLDNAIKFSPGGGDIEVEVKALGHKTVEISVRDHGVGIPPERREGIFSRFYQAHQSGYSGGMGLGLYISKQIVELHGGTIEAQFPEDGGTRFVVTLPKEASGARDGHKSAD